MTTTLSRPSLADIVSAFEALGPREQFWMLDKLASIAGLELDLDDLAQQSAENTVLCTLNAQGEVDQLLFNHRPEPYHELRDKSLAHAFKTDAERRAETLARLTPAQREKRLEYIKGEG